MNIRYLLIFLSLSILLSDCATSPDADAHTGTVAIRRSKDFKGFLRSRVIRKIDLPRGYHEGLFLDGKDIWVANGEGGNIWVVDLETGRVKREITPVAGFTEGVAASNGNIVATDWYEKKLYRVTIEGDCMVAHESVSFSPAYPAGVAWDGSDLFVIAWTRGFGTRFELLRMDEGLKVLERMDIQRIQEPAHIAWDGQSLWVTSWYNQRVYRIDKKSWEITGYFRSPVPRTTGIAWDGKRFWLTGTYGDLYQIELGLKTKGNEV